MDMTVAGTDINDFMELFHKKEDIFFCERAAEIYRGTLLADEFYEWTSLLESFYEIKYMELLTLLIKHYEQHPMGTKKDYYISLYRHLSEG